MADLIAWSPIRNGKDDNVEVIKPGDSVTQDALGLSDEQFAQLVESGAIRTLEYPDMPDSYQDSPVNFLREQARKAAEGTLADAESSEENMNAILAANAAATGSVGAPMLDPEIQATMEAQLADTGASDSKVSPTGGTGTTQVSPDS